jgi:hypothetical protein
MAKADPRIMPNQAAISLNGQLSVKGSIEDTVAVKDSTIYRIQKCEYLVKKGTGYGADDLLMWLDELSNQGWELINKHPMNLGFYIFKKPAK